MATETAQAKGALPDDFPGHSALEAAGITTFAKLRAAGDVTEVPGIGAATEAKISKALADADAAAAAPEPAATEASETAASETAAAASSETIFEAPVSTVNVVCPKCGIGGHVASEELIGVAECGDPGHPGTKLVRA